ncbi:Ig-like domain-containing protein [Clostridium sp. YIM B02555]|uniref:Ig-like domain-containing protein n=1 Tax=Clostridium sp. YIM B02555 TaxID=2911968 RepID=UPI001EEF1D48|nr:Ig-like domain-containing protein [Clostridium sp. YIM B02555]
MKNYFKKFSIMLMMALAIIGIGMIYGGKCANAATVGQQLISPENGWKRIDGTDSKFVYGRTFGVVGDGADYKSNDNRSRSIDTMSFSFVGTKLRLIDVLNYDWSNNMSIIIDGVNYTTSMYRNSPQYQTIYFQKLDLQEGNHNVIIKSNVGGYWGIDCIDIDDTGYLLPYAETISLDKSSMNLKLGESGQLIATTTPAGVQVTWKSNDSSIAIVNSATGEVIGKSVGTCTITATTADGLTATCTVTVNKENKSISLNKSTTNLTIDDSETLIETTTPAGISVKWSSSDISVATVDSNGKVIAIGAGTATITATTLDGSNLSASCLVTVVPKGNDPAQAGSEYITNIAHAKGDNTNNAGGDVTIIFHGTADTTLSVVKTADVQDVWVGDNFTYTLVITNTGAKTAKAVVVNDLPPNHIDFNVGGVTTTQGSVDSRSTSKYIIVNVGDIPPAGTVTIKVPATVIA